MWIAFAFGSALFAGATAILSKVGLEQVNSNLATALRTAVVLVFAWGIVFAVGAERTLPEVSARGYLFLALSGLATGASWVCYFRALQLGDVSKVAPVDKSSTVLTILLAALFLGEAFTAFTLCAVALMAAGAWLMAWTPGKKEAKPDGRRWLLFAVLSAVFAALTGILGKIGVENVEPNLATALRTVVVLALAWAIVFAQKRQRDIRAIGKKSWLFLVASGVATGLSWLCFYHALQSGPAGVVVPIDKLSIVVTVVFSVVFLKEKLRARAWVGLALVVAGTMLLLV